MFNLSYETAYDKYNAHCTRLFVGVYIMLHMYTLYYVAHVHIHVHVYIIISVLYYQLYMHESGLILSMCYLCMSL